MIEEFFVYVLVASVAFGLGYACGTHTTWLPAIGGKIGGLFKRKAAPVQPQTAVFTVPGILPDTPWPRVPEPPPTRLVPEVGWRAPTAPAAEVKTRPSWVKT